MQDSKEANDKRQWFVMRDLKRVNAKQPAYMVLGDMGMEVFTPMTERLVTRRGRKVREKVPFMQSLLFVRSDFLYLTKIVEQIPTLQFRWPRNTYRAPMTVPDADMDEFMQAVQSSDNVRYYLPQEITSKMCGRKIRVVGGPLGGREGRLLTVRGSKVKRLIIEFQDIVCAGIEVNPEYIEFI